MSKKRITVRDLALECGVATGEAISLLQSAFMHVPNESYRLNDSEAQKARSILKHGSSDQDAAPFEASPGASVASKDGSRDADMQSLPENEPAPSSQEARCDLETVFDQWRVLHRDNDALCRYVINLYKNLVRKAGSTLPRDVTEEGRDTIEGELDRILKLHLIAHEREEQERAMREAEEREPEEQERARREAEEREREEQEREAARKAERERREAERQKREEEARKRWEAARPKREERKREEEERAKAKEECVSILRNRISDAARLLFGSETFPTYDGIKAAPGLLDRLKELRFGDDVHPEGYPDQHVVSYYALRYELGYAFEYQELYGILIDLMGQDRNLGVLSVGCGQGLDYWGLRYALTCRKADDVTVFWRGVDLEKWPEPILEDDCARHYYGKNVLDHVAGLSSMHYQVMMFPKVISELPCDVVSELASWLGKVKYQRPVHYLCFAHTERNTLEPKWRDCFDVHDDAKIDGVKSYTLFAAARTALEKQGYVWDEALDRKLLKSRHLETRTYRVRSRRGMVDVPYLVYDESLCKSAVGDIDGTFSMQKTVREAVKSIGEKCCEEFVLKGRGDCGNNGCTIHDVCCLYRYPRFKLDRMAYQVFRFVKKEEAQS